MKTETLYIKNQEKFTSNLRNDQIYVDVKEVPMAELTGMPATKRLEKAIVSEGQIVNVVSGQYGLLDNKNYFAKVEEKLIMADIDYVTRSINRNNGSFSVDYILKDPRYIINVANGKDKILPMLSFTNSYDSTCKTSGRLSFYREVCTNGLHVTQLTSIGFKVKHRGDVNEIVLPQLDSIIASFIENEYYSLSRKFEVLAEKKIDEKQLTTFIAILAKNTGLFSAERELKTKEVVPTKTAMDIIASIENEANLVGTEINGWLVYNAFNQHLHNNIAKSFDNQKLIDEKIFNHILELA